MRRYILHATGTLDTSQFFPFGESDADTLRVRVVRDGFRIRDRRSPHQRITHAFEHASAIGRGTHLLLVANRTMRVRLQGVDAPVLHYMPVAPGITGLSRAFRQPGGEHAALALAKQLRTLGHGEIRCVVETRVNGPDDVFDAYGRCVADVFVGTGNTRVHINDWLLRNGWAIPSLYDSLEHDEIARIVASADFARRAHRGVWSRYTPRLAGFAWRRIFRRLAGHAPAAGEDSGEIMHPKFFRRVAAWTFARRAGLFAETFRRYLASPSVKESIFERAEFVARGAAASGRPLVSALAGGALLLAPSDMVFREAASRLESAEGHPVTRW